MLHLHHLATKSIFFLWKVAVFVKCISLQHFMLMHWYIFHAVSPQKCVNRWEPQCNLLKEPYIGGLLSAWLGIIQNCFIMYIVHMWYDHYCLEARDCKINIFHAQTWLIVSQGCCWVFSLSIICCSPSIKWPRVLGDSIHRVHWINIHDRFQIRYDELSLRWAFSKC